MRLLDALRHRNFRLFYAGQAVSLLGDAAFSVALAWQVVASGGSAETLGLVLTAYMGAQVALLLVGGVLVDRLPRRAVVVAADLTQLVLCVALAAMAGAGALTTPRLVGLALLFGGASAIAMPAMSAFVPETVPLEALPSANSLYQGTRTVAMLAGPALGGALVAAGGTWLAFAFDALSFAVSAALLLTARGLPGARPGEGSPLRAAWAGVRYVAGIPWIWIAIVIFSVLNVAEAGPRNVALPLLLARDLGLGPESLGLAQSASAAGGLVATLAVGSLRLGPRRGALAYAGIVLGGAAFTGLGLAPDLAIVMLASALRGAAFAGFGIVWESSLQQRVDPAMRGRVASLDMLGSFALLPVAMAATGVLAEARGPRSTLLAGGLVIVACGLVGLALPKARRFEVEA